MKVKGEIIYKAAERIKKYGVEAFIKMLGKTAIKKRGGMARLLKYYTTKYPSAPLTLEPKAPYISRSMRSYWKDVKALSEERNIPIKETRKLLKRLKTDKNVQVRVIKSGEGWQLIMLGLYELKEKGKQTQLEYFREIGIERPDLEEQAKCLPGTQREMLGYSKAHRVETNDECYDEALGECIRYAQGELGGSGWLLIKILKETWIRYYGREK